MRQVSATRIGDRRFRIKLTGKLNLSPIMGGGNVGPEYFVNEERDVVLLFYYLCLR